MNVLVDPLKNGCGQSQGTELLGQEAPTSPMFLCIV